MARPVYDSALGGSCPRCGKRLDRCNCGGQQTRAQVASGPAAQLPRDGVVRVMRDCKNRKGKVVTVIVGVPINEAAALGTELKRLCGTGGTVRAHVVEVQGDHRDRVVELLRERGYQVKLAGA